MSVDPHQLRKLLQTATPVPWEMGHVWMRAGVMSTKFGNGKCALCERNGQPVWSGRCNINGTRMLAHLHRIPPYDDSHLISGADGTEVAGNYDYEAGGILRREDTELIVAVVNALPALLQLAELLNEWLALGDVSGGGYGGTLVSRTEAALASVRPGQEQSGCPGPDHYGDHSGIGGCGGFGQGCQEQEGE